MMRHFNKKSPAAFIRFSGRRCDFLRMCLVCSILTAIFCLTSACSSTLPVGDKTQLDLIETIRDPRRTDFKKALAKTSDLNFADESGKTPLIYAIERGNKLQIRDLLKHGADPALQDRIGYTALHHAAVLPDSTALSVLLQAGVSPDLPGGDQVQNKTPLMEAARIGEAANVELLLKHKANPLSQDVHGRTPLMFAAMAPKYAKRIVQTLLNHGADHTQADENGHIPLFQAIIQKNQAAALHLLALLPDFDKKSKFMLMGLAAMRHAISSGNADMVKEILKKKLPVNYDLSVVYKTLRFATVEGWYKILAANGVINDGKTPIFWAAQADNTEIIKILLDAGANPTAKDHAGTLPVDYARQRDTSNLLKSAAKKWRAEQHRKLNGEK